MSTGMGINAENPESLEAPLPNRQQPQPQQQQHPESHITKLVADAKACGLLPNNIDPSQVSTHDIQQLLNVQQQAFNLADDIIEQDTDGVIQRSLRQAALNNGGRLVVNNEKLKEEITNDYINRVMNPEGYTPREWDVMSFLMTSNDNNNNSNAVTVNNDNNADSPPPLQTAQTGDDSTISESLPLTLNQEQEEEEEVTDDIMNEVTDIQDI